ncbi:MAG: hypothetical protein JSR36_07950 [Proteobacteria bacterium]|nr:hypothetical protein [Pseudomonadota bacterium]
MDDPKFSKPPPRPAATGTAPNPRAGSPAAGGSPSRAPALAARPPSGKPAARSGGDGATGKVVHDDRGNAVWDFLKQSGRHAIESTSRLLRRLEAPELKFEDPKDEELRVMPDPSTGGGYDPYNQATKPSRKFFGK